MIIDIKRHALHDGPGIRTTVFFKGCPLNCVWCHNPESMEPRPEIGFYPADCIQCGDCVNACLTGAVQMNLAARINRAMCNNCGKCAEACPGHGLRQIGRLYDIDELLDIVLRDRAYYQTSSGGVTLSGGEPALHIAYASQLLQKLKSSGIHTAIETCGYFEWTQFETNMLGWLDMILFDVKLANSELHQKYTGKGNEIILQNLASLVQARPDDVIARIPLIPGITAIRSNLQELSVLLREMGIKRCWLLPYNPLGFSKWSTIGKTRVDMPERMLTRQEIDDSEGIFSWAEIIEL